MLTRSQLRHTAMDNGFAPLFEPHQQEATRRVIAGEAGQEEFLGIRARLNRWPTVRRDVEANLKAFEETYTPFMEAVELLRNKMPQERWAALVACHRARVSALLRISSFVSTVRGTMSAFENALEAVATGRMSVEQLGCLHAEMVDAYRIP